MSVLGEVIEWVEVNRRRRRLLRLQIDQFEYEREIDNIRRRQSRKTANTRTVHKIAYGIHLFCLLFVCLFAASHSSSLLAC